MFIFMQSITFDTPKPLNLVRESSVISLPAIFTLWYTRVHVYTTHSGNEYSYVEAPINKSFHFETTLDIPNINPNYCYVQLWEDCDNTRSQCQSYIVENVILSNNVFDHIWSNWHVNIFSKIWNTCDFKIWLRLRKPWNIHSLSFNSIYILDVVFDCLKFQFWCNLASNNDYTS